MIIPSNPKRLTTAIAIPASFLDSAIFGAIAAIAVDPQMAVPNPIKYPVGVLQGNSFAKWSHFCDTTSFIDVFLQLFENAQNMIQNIADSSDYA